MAELNDRGLLREGEYPEFVSSENGCKHIGKNYGNHIRHYRVDGGIFPSGATPERCDYLLLNDTKKTAYYIELKGSDIPKATKQIDRTVEQLHLSHPNYTIYRRIIYRTGRSHEVNSQEVVRWKAKHGAKTIVITSRQHVDQL